jgi:hypothetical protein
LDGKHQNHRRRPPTLPPSRRAAQGVAQMQDKLLNALKTLGVFSAGTIDDPRRWSASDLVKDVVLAINQASVKPGDTIAVLGGSSTSMSRARRLSI